MRQHILNTTQYKIYCGKNALRQVSAFLKKKNYSTCLILCDENTLKHCLPVLLAACPELASSEIIEIESGEQSKSLEICSHIWHSLLEQQTDKTCLLINLGGGVVCDLGGFVASVYKRGIDFIHLPCSLLAMADASVGGKTGIDFMNIKNSLGTFSNPAAVFIYPPFLSSLSERHFINGMAEIYKIALVADKKLWYQLLEKQTSIEEVILKSVSLKNKLVLKDPFDDGIRKILNFGHTIGHAIEALFMGQSNELLHGEAIYMGMITEAHLSFQKKLLNKKELIEIVKVLSTCFYSPAIKESAFETIIELIGNDKKNRNKTFRFSLLHGIGKAVFNQTIEDSQIKKALHFYNTINQ